MSVEEVLRLGDDALLNQYQVVFPQGIPSGGNASAIALRMDQTFAMPNESTYTYNLDHKGTIVPKTGKKEETDKTLTIQVRVDQKWKVYDDLRAWHKMGFDPDTNIAVSDALVRVPMVIQALDNNNKVSKNFTFTYVKLKDLKVADFDNASGDPIRLDLVFIYGSMIVS